MGDAHSPSPLAIKTSLSGPHSEKPRKLQEFNVPIWTALNYVSLAFRLLRSNKRHFREGKDNNSLALGYNTFIELAIFRITINFL